MFDGLSGTLDAMAYNRMNVFHWYECTTACIKTVSLFPLLRHIVDSYSFPFVSESIPELSKHGIVQKNRLTIHVSAYNVANS